MRRDFTTGAVLALFLYFCGYIPGLLANIGLLLSAWDEKDYYGEAPGFGCLVGLLLVFGIGPIAALLFAFLAGQLLFSPLLRP